MEKYVDFSSATFEHFLFIFCNVGIDFCPEKAFNKFGGM